MLHTKFSGNRPAGSREDFRRVFTICRCGGHLGHVTQMPQTNFSSPYPRRLHIKFGFDLPSGLRADVWNWWRQRTNGWQMDARPWVYYKLAMSLRLRWAKKAEKLKLFTDWGTHRGSTLILQAHLSVAQGNDCLLESQQVIKIWAATWKNQQCGFWPGLTETRL